MNIKYLIPGLSILFLYTSVAQAESLNNQVSLLDSEINFSELNLESDTTQKINVNNLEIFSQATFASNIPTDFKNNKEEKVSSVNTTAPQSSEDTKPIPTTLAQAEFTNYQTNTQSLDPVIIPNDSMAQLTNVSQLRDVQPGDWAYEALRSLVERYGCIVGYPNQTYRGDRAMNRYEFAAGLNACLQQMERLIAESEAVNREDLETLQRLSKEFEAELATIAGRIDNLEGRVAFLEDHQFSTTTKLNGEVVFGLADAFGGDPPGGCSIVEVPDGPPGNQLGANCTNTTDPDTNTVFAYLARLGLETSFTGQDRLRMYLTTGNFGSGDSNVPGSGGGFTNPESLNTYMARLGYQAGLNNEVFLDILEYRFPAFNDRVAFYASTFGFALSNVLTANSPFFDIGRGSISRFGQLNPILRIGGAMDGGVGFDWLIADPLRLQVAYGTRNSGDPNDGGGIAGADHSALGVQFLVQPTDNIVAGINYVNAYASDGVLGTYTGSVNAETGGLWSDAYIPGPEGSGNSPFSACCRFPLNDEPAQINAVGGSFQWRMTEQLTFAAWGGYTFSNFLNELPDEGGFSNDFVVGNPANIGIGASAGKKPYANTATFTLSLGLSDPFGREGDLFGFIFGMPPKLVAAGPETPGTPVPFFEQVINDEQQTTVTDNNPNLDTVGIAEAGGGAVPLVQQGVLPKRVGQEDEATSLHFEFFYRFKVNDNLWITPGFFFVTNPGHIADNDTIYVGTLRTTFRF
jgi:hypothetical protein